MPDAAPLRLSVPEPPTFRPPIVGLSLLRGSLKGELTDQLPFVDDGMRGGQAAEAKSQDRREMHFGRVRKGQSFDQTGLA